MKTCPVCKRSIGDVATKCKYCFTEQVPTVAFDDIILTASQSMEGYEIIEYQGITYGEVVCPNGIFGAITNGTFYTVSALADGRFKALESLKENAKRMGANAVIGVDIDISDLNGKGVLVSANGTAVFVIPENYIERKAEYEKKAYETRVQAEELQQQKEQLLADKMGEINNTNEYSLLEKNIVKTIIENDNMTVISIMKMFSRNFEQSEVVASFNKLVDNGIVEKDEYGICHTKLEI